MRTDSDLYAIRPGQALDAAIKGMKNPDDTKQAARMVEALQGRSPLRMLQRVKRSSKGRRLLQERPDLLSALKDAKWLASLPEGTLGREYYEFCQREQLTPGGLDEAVAEGFDRSRLERMSEDEQFLQTWMRDTHDLYHVLTGYGTDLLGELGVLTFTATQTRNPAIWFMVLVGGTVFAARGHANPRLFAGAIWRGLRARSIITPNWKRLLEQPLSQIRRELRVPQPPRYKPAYTSLDRSAMQL
ncbi:MAG: hypothetical protein KDH09_09865 [Chrysiogenetes bacterium]|nr:hypothetical protein [Chrysiogenetes bacterium]